jgi:hypothetical protein
MDQIAAGRRRGAGGGAGDAGSRTRCAGTPALADRFGDTAEPAPINGFQFSARLGL